ncbi:hypothetical protein ACFQS1_37240 [Paractinoplanes rhizophilus]|jgi:hypothetical protein|uniref:Uncharacterized protein n=1 Tax=Paractinoplanes rhizophilus TaxID=1416877 RepID=A0ABW2I422_9ACTN
MTDQMVFLGLNRTTSSKIVVKNTRRKLGQRVSLPVAEGTILVEVGRAAQRLRGGPIDRLAELREAAARRVREMPDYPDPEDEQAEHFKTVVALEALQAETSAWKAGE